MNENPRVNITMSEDLKNWYNSLAKEMGMPTSSLMCLALAQYREQKQAVSIMENMPKFFEELQKMIPQGGAKNE
jgi:hypothetical protein